MLAPAPSPVPLPLPSREEAESVNGVVCALFQFLSDNAFLRAFDLLPTDLMLHSDLPATPCYGNHVKA